MELIKQFFSTFSRTLADKTVFPCVVSFLIALVGWIFLALKLKRKLIGVVCVVIILAIVSFVLIVVNFGRSIDSADNTYPDYKSEVFETVFEGKYGKKTVSEIESMSSLDLSNCGLDDIRDIAMFTGLTSLILNDNHIKDVTPLEKLYGLTELNLGGNDITDISGLFHLSSLTVLNVRQNNIGSINVISFMPKLTWLTAYSCGLTDISPVRYCPLLEHVSIGYYNYINDFSPLFDLANLKEIKLQNLSISSSQKQKLESLFPSAKFVW